MAKSFNSSLPKVISKANRDISTIIESDIASESRILKNLVDQVLKANLEVKKKNNARITETKRRITELDSEIANLNITIDDVDRDTVIRQLNEMIHTENNIFNAKQEIRFFDNEKAQEKIDSFNELEKELTESLSDLYSFEDDYHTTLLSGNALLFNKQIEITNEIIGLMKDMFDNKQVIINEKLLEFKVIEDNITSLELDFQSEITATISKYTEIRNANIGTFSAEDDDEFISDKIEKDHNDTIDRINENITSTTETYNDAIKLLKDEFALFEENTRLKLENRDKQALDKEKQKEKEKEEQLKNIRLLIMDAEKKNNFGKVTKLLKQFDKIEKTKAGKQTQQVTKEFDQITKKPRIKYINQ